MVQIIEEKVPVIWPCDSLLSHGDRLRNNATVSGLYIISRDENVMAFLACLCYVHTCVICTC